MAFKTKIGLLAYFVEKWLDGVQCILNFLIFPKIPKNVFHFARFARKK